MLNELDDICSVKVFIFCMLFVLIHGVLYLGLFSVPTRIIIVVAPINVLLNYILGLYPF